MTDPELQAADRVITLHIKQALAVIEIRLLVNIVVGADGTVSLAILGGVEHPLADTFATQGFPICLSSGAMLDKTPCKALAAAGLSPASSRTSSISSSLDARCPVSSVSIQA